MKTIVLCIAAVSLAVGGSAFAGTKPNAHSLASKHATVAKCDEPVSTFLHDIAGDIKDLSVSAALTPKQYSFVRETVKTHSIKHTDAPGDSAFVIDAGGVFMLALTKGIGDDAMFCAIMKVPAEIVAGIVAVDDPPKVTTPSDSPAAPKGEWQ